MKIIIVFLAFFSASLCVAQTQGWYKQNPGTGHNLGRVIAFGRDTAWFGTGIGLFRTINGGKLWTNIAPAPIISPQFTDPSHAFCIRTGTALGVSDDGGFTWRSIAFEQFFHPIGYMQMFDTNNIFISGGFNGISRLSLQNGQILQWSRQTPRMYKRMRFYNPRYGFAVGDRASIDPQPDRINGTFMFTQDSGKSWQTRITSIAENLWNVFPLTDSIIYVVGEHELIAKTEDRGFSWKILRHIDTSIMVYTEVSFLNKNVGMISGPWGRILRTLDGGETWEEQNTHIRFPDDTSANLELRSITFVDSLNVWVSGVNGTLLHTTTGGGTSGVHATLPLIAIPVIPYPEPFAAKTTISYSIPRAAKVSIHIYDITGKELKVLESPGIQEAGMHSIEFDGSAYPEGVFHYRLEADGFYGMGKMTKIVF